MLPSLPVETIGLITKKEVKLQPILKLVVLSNILIATSGCDQTRQQVADFLNPPTPEVMVIRVQNLAKNANTKEAIAAGEAFLESGKDQKGLVAHAVLQAYLQKGDAEGAVSFMQRFPKHNSGQATTQSIDTSSVKLQDRQHENTNTTSFQSNQVRAGSASVTETESGTVLRAGDATVIMPK